MREINEDNVFLYDKDFFKYTEDVEDTFLYKGTEMPWSHVKAVFMKVKAKPDRCFDLAKAVYDEGLVLTSFNAKKLEVAEHSGKGDDFANDFKESGYTKLGADYRESTYSRVKEEFENDRRFRGRLPGIADYIARWAEMYGDVDKVASNFVVDNIRKLMSFKLSPADVVSMYMLLPKETIQSIQNYQTADAVAYELGKFLSNNKKDHLDKAEAHLHCANWIANHSSTSIDLIEEIVENAVSIFSSERSENITVPMAQAMIKNAEAYDEVKKIEKAYKKPGFKLENCVCELKQCEVEEGRYKAYIMDAKDPRQVMLGEATNCCQCLGDAGETSMMHGLINPKAGFFVIEEISTGLIKAQAESWEYDDNTLVFDNIEFANDAPIDTYKDVLAVWLLNSGYKNVAMGMGYNELRDTSFEEAPAMVPPVTPYEIYVMSYEDDADIPDYCERTAPHKRESDSYDELMELPSEEIARLYLEEGRINYYDYLYSDTDDNKGLVWLKENERVADYFDVGRFSIMEEEVDDALYKYAKFIEDYSDSLDREDEEEMER